jgi:PAS domain S-box-containing protein
VVKSWFIHRWFSVWLGALLFSLTAYGAATGSPKRVLVLDPFGRNVAPFTTAVSSFRTTLARELGEPVDIYELPLELARFSGPEGETPLVTFLEGRLKEQPVDLVVASEPRMMSPELLRTNATAVTQRVSLPGMVEDILRLQPQTTNIVVVFGASTLERFWTEQCRREFQVFTNRVGFTWVNDLTLGQILRQCSALPPNSFVLHALFIVDAAGVPCEKNEALRQERPWPESLINRLQLAAQIFANALARKRTDHALRESELRLQMATDSAGAGLWVLEWSSGEFWANAKARSIFGYTADEPLNLARFEASVIPEDWMRVRDSISSAAKTGAPVDVEYRIKLADGTDRWMASRGRPFFKANGEPERLVGLSLDITGQRQAEVETRELRNALAHSDRVSALGHLASALAHELSQPLGAILRNAEAAEIMLQEASPDLEELRAIVADKGRGIARECPPRLFEPFFTTKPSGMGVGLAVSKTIIEAHQGILWAENDPTGGARFRFTVPVSPGAAVPPSLA